jgi:NAD(P)-dependent dehydrogenase (short-subunit alcohol dehydrogenase family)
MSAVLITGANRGIGLELVRQYAADGWKVHACCRTPGKASDLKALPGDITIHALDVADVNAIKTLGASLDEPLDVVIANAGLGGKEVGDFGAIDYDAFANLLAVNTLGPISMLEAFAPHLKETKGKFAAITSELGSVARASGYAPAYSTSKAALNMAVKSYAATLAAAGVAIAPLHPGWVRTDMGGASAPVTPRESVSGLRNRITEMQATPSPRYLDFSGAELPW